MELQSSIYKMYRSIFVTFAILFIGAYSQIPEHHSEISKIKIHEWLIQITKGIDVARKIANNEGFEIIDEIPELKLFKFSYLNLTEEIKKEEIEAKFSKYKEISWHNPVTIMTYHTSNFPFGRISITDPDDLIAMFLNDPHPHDYDEDIPIFTKTFPKFFLPDSNMKIPHIQSRPELQKYPNLYCAGPENIVIKSNKPPFCNDPLYPQQWFLRSCNEFIEPEASFYDIKLHQTWQDFDVYGRGIKILVLDDGVKIDHEDLVVDPEYSYNFYTPFNRNDPSPANSEESHGTYCAGVIGMKKDNGICGVGIAPEATIGGMKIDSNHEGDTNSLSKALMYKKEQVHIVTTSTFSSSIFHPVEREVESALTEGANKGRGGKGLLYLISAGNQKDEETPITCSRIPILNSIYMISIGGVNHDGTVSSYANRCSNVMTVLYSGDGYPYTIPTIAMGRSNEECMEHFNGTSASTPMATGALALVLEANPDLSWRDVHHIIAWTSEVAPLSKNRGWTKNAAGFYVNLDFGFGLMNIYEMVSLAKNFKKTTPPMHGCSVSVTESQYIEIDINSPKKFEIPFSGCEGETMEVNYIEHVLLNVNMKYYFRGDLQIRLTSPRGTTVDILEPRKYDSTGSSIYDYNFHSIHTWGENPKGTWTLYIFDNSNTSSNEGVIFDVSLMVYGTKEKPELYKNEERKYYPFELKYK